MYTESLSASLGAGELLLFTSNIFELLPTSFLQFYHTLTLITRDSMALVSGYMERIIMEKMSRLQDTTRVQVGE